MSQITLRQLPVNVERRIRKIAEENHISINKTIINLLQKALGLKPNETRQRDLSDIAGVWSDKDVRDFEETQKQFNIIDDEIWSSDR